MLDFVVALLVLLYGLALSFVLFHSLSDAHLIYHYLISFPQKKHSPYLGHFNPHVTIQLPVYKEL